MNLIKFVAKKKFLRVMHNDQTKDRIAQQFRDSRQALSEFDVKRSRSIFRISRQSQVFRDFFYVILLSDQ
jgi:hypothetical protein